jgi:small subunit ribosomal protein S9
MAELTKKKTSATTKTPRAKKPVAEKVVEETVAVAAPSHVSDDARKALGRRKTAIVRIRLQAGSGRITVNGRPYDKYFTTYELRGIVEGPFKALGQEKSFDVEARATGGGIRGQAESVRLAIARALVAKNPDTRTVLKKLGFMTRDPRAKERKKFGLKRARRAPQWSKR